MKKILILFFGFAMFLGSCDHVENIYTPQASTDLDTTLYPGLWSDYVANEWPIFTPNTNTNRNILIEDYTGHKCVFCPAAADLAEALHNVNPSRVFVASIHSGPEGIGDFQTVTLPDYPVNFTNPQGVEIGTYFGTNDGGFPGNPRGTINRLNSGGVIFQNPNAWTNLTNTMLSNNDLKVNIQSHLNFYPTTKGAFLHTEVEKLDASLGELGIVVYMIEDSLIGDQKMNDNSHNSSYIHREIHRGCVDGNAFGKTLTPAMLVGNKYQVNYSFVVPNQLNGNFNAENMHVLIYVYDKTTWEIYQVIKQYIL
jgi:hypothetical protein